jgi:hypothetical protein
LLATVLLILYSLVPSATLCQPQTFAWWLTWTLRPTGTEVEGVSVRTLNRNWLTASVIVPLPDQARQRGERPEEHGLVFSSTRISMAILKANELLRRLSAAIAGAAQRTPMRFRHSA